MFRMTCIERDLEERAIKVADFRGLHHDHTALWETEVFFQLCTFLHKRIAAIPMQC